MTATPLPSWGYFAGRITAAVLLADAAALILVLVGALEHSALDGRDLAVLGAWAVGCLLISVRFFAWDPHRPRHARLAGAGTVPRSA